MTTPAHLWTFNRIGNLSQVCLTSAEDLRRLGELDPKLWVALACPVRGLDLDQRTLHLIDSDGDGRIRVPEVIAAVQWVCARLRDPALILTEGERLPLAALATGEHGDALRASARRILTILQTPDAVDIGPSETGDTLHLLSAARFNGDGVVPAAVCEDPAVAAMIEEIITTMGSQTDRGGDPGVGLTEVNAFAEALGAYHNWWSECEVADSAGAGLLPLAEATPAAAVALAAVRAKIDDYFARCRLAAFAPQSIDPLGGSAADWKTLAGQDLSFYGPEIEALPIQRPAAGLALALREGGNPAWEARLKAFRQQVVEPLLGSAVSELQQHQWEAIVQRFAAFNAWSAAKQGAAVEALGISRIRSLLNGPEVAAIRTLVEQDLAVAGEIDGIADVDRLVLYRRDLYRFLRNFISFQDFYRANYHALFQTGYVYIDQRRCDLVLQVDDFNKHVAFAGLARCCVLYATATRKGETPITLAAVLTRGSVTHLMAGSNGIFYDRKGRDWDITVQRVAEAPISVIQGFWMPWRKLIQLIENQIEKLAASKSQAVEGGLASGIDKTAHGVVAPSDPKTASGTVRTPFDIAKFAGIFAAIGLALGALGGAVGSMLAAFASLAWWQIPLALLGILLVVSGPSMILAWLKLRQRTLGPLLEGCGWAINGRVRITHRLKTALTHLQRLPLPRRSGLNDPFSEAPLWPWLVLGLLCVAGVGAVWWWWDALLSYWFGIAPAPESEAAAGDAVASPPAMDAAPELERPLLGLPKKFALRGV